MTFGHRVNFRWHGQGRFVTPLSKLDDISSKSMVDLVVNASASERLGWQTTVIR